jgi:Bacterial membrane protein YfhO
VRPLTRAAAIVLFVLPLVFTGRAVLHGDVYGPVDLAYATEPLHELRNPMGIGSIFGNGTLSDVASQMIPWRKAVQYALRHGEWPLLNRFTLCGDVLAAAAQPAAYSPFTLLACLLPVAKSFTYTAAIWFFIAGLSAFLFAAELLECGGHAAALIAAAGWMYATGLSFFILWPLGECWTLLPLVLLSVRRIAQTPGIASASLLTTALTLMILAGHPETVVHMVYLGAAWGVFELIRVRRNPSRAIAFAAAAGVVTLLICAIYLLPFVDALHQTAEYQFRTEVLRHWQRGLPLDDALIRLAIDALPFLHQQPLTALPIAPDSAAVGSILLAAALYAIVRVRSAESWMLAGLTVFCLLARAEFGPVARALEHFPLLNLAINGRFSFATSFFLVMLAALGLERLDRRAAIAFTLVLLALTAGTLAMRAHTDWPYWAEYKIFAELAGLGVATLVVLRMPKRALPILLVLVIAQRTLEERGNVPTFPASAAYPRVPLFDPMRGIREPFRIAGFNYALIPGASALYGLEDVRGYEAMTLLRLTETYELWSVPQPTWFNRVVDLQKPFLSFLNVRFAVTNGGMRTPPGWRMLRRTPEAHLLENEHWLPRAFVPAETRMLPKDDVVLDEMRGWSDFGQRVWLSGPSTEPAHPNGPGRVTRIANARLGYTIDAEMQRDGWIAVSEAAWAGWRAYVDGRRVRPAIANVAFLAVPVPAGKHTVQLVYLPRSFVIGRAVTFCTLGALLLAGLWYRRKCDVDYASRRAGA